MTTIITLKRKVKKLMMSKGKSFINDTRGEFNIKTLALAVAAIVLVAFIVNWLMAGRLVDGIEQVWEWVWETIIGMFTV